MEGRREEILDVVLDFLAQPQSGQSLTINNIAKHANLAKSSIYEYFTDKTTMIVEALSRLIDKNTQTLLMMESFDNLDFNDAFSQHIERFLSLGENNQMMHTYMRHPMVATLPDDEKQRIHVLFKSAMQKVQARYYAIIQKGIDENILRDDVPLERKRTVEALLLGGVVALNSPHNDWDKSRQINDLLQSTITLYNS